MKAKASILSTARAALGAGVACALGFGVLDASVAAAVSDAEPSTLAFLGCAAAAVLTYSAVWIPLALAVGLVLHPMLARQSVERGRIHLLAIGLALGSFCELYWWTRPFVFYGRSSLSPARLSAAAAMLVVSFVVARFLARFVVAMPRAMWRGLVFGWIACCVAGGVYLLAQDAAADRRGQIDDRNRDMPNVLLVIVDAMRQDVLGCYGNATVRTPAMDRLAAQGVLFENAFVQVPFTWPSFGSLLTGKYPRRHGLIKMAPGERMEPNITLAYHFKTALKKDGRALADGDYVNATFHTGTLSEGSGLLRGFDLRFEATAGHDLVVLDNPWSVLRAHLLLSIFRQKMKQRFDSGIVATAARDWIARNPHKRFFAMVHLYSTHTPYDPPREFRDLYVDPQYDGPVKAFYAQHREMIEKGDYAATPADIAQIRNLYYAGVSQADRLIGELVGDLDRLGIREDTLVIVTADHGESLGEQALWEHNHMVQSNLRVPLIMSWPKKLPQGARVAPHVDEIDVVPTICELAGIEAPAEPGERGRIDGVSLMPLIRGDVESVRPYSFAENGFFASIQDARTKLIVRRRLLKAATFESARECWLQALDNKELEPRLYDLVADSSESHNVLAQRMADAERLFRALYEWSASMPIALEKNTHSERDLEQIELMKNLGYTAGGIGGDEDEGDCGPAPAGEGTQPSGSTHAGPGSKPK